MQEMVPANETVQNWTEMVTVQIFLNRKDLDPTQPGDDWRNNGLGRLRGSTATPAVAGKANGYTRRRAVSSPLLARRASPETTMMKAIKGNDSFYLVQRAVAESRARAAGTDETSYLEAVGVCDTRLPASPARCEARLLPTHRRRD